MHVKNKLKKMAKINILGSYLLIFSPEFIDFQKVIIL